VDIAAEFARRVVVLDGGLATELERRGADLSSDLWSARLLRDDPGEIVDAHRAFVEAGAEIVTSASYQASFEGLGDEAEPLMRLSVRLAREAGPRWVAASVGPYGAVLADGSEYRGDYGLSVTELRLWHRRRLAVLADAGADVLAVETIPCLAEVEAVCAELVGVGAPAWVSLTCAGVATRAGESAAEAFAIASECPAVIAIGVNCTDPADVDALMPLAARAGRPVVVYPNSGESWDATERRWVGPGQFAPSAVLGWVDAGARLVGGCCRVRPEDIRRIKDLVRSPRSLD
jgi:homocysteine S-methyltransferase